MIRAVRLPGAAKPLPMILLSVMLVPFLFFLGCSGKGGRKPAGGEGDASSAKAPILVVAVPYEPDHLLPQAARSPGSAALWGWVFPSLVRVEADSMMRGRLVGDLATSWQLDDDRKGIRFHIASDRLWDDTTAVSTGDVVTSYRLFRDPAIAGSWGRRLDEIVSIEAPEASPGMVLFRFRRPLALERALQLATLPVISAAQWAKSMGVRPQLGEPGRIPRSAGPFRIDEWKPGDYIRLIRHPFPPADRIPRAERILLRFAPNGMSRGMEVEQGAADVAIDLPSEEMQRLREEGPSVRLERSGPIEVEALVWNLDHPIWGRWDLRRDVEAHLDTAHLRVAAAGGWEGAPSLPATGIFEAETKDTVAAGAPGAAPTIAMTPADSIPPFSFAAYGNPSLEILYDAADARRERIAVEIALQLERFGLPIQLRPLSAAECAARIEERRFDAVVTGCAIPAIHDVGETWESGGIFNIAGLRASGVDSLISVARSAAADTIPDAWDRVELRAHFLVPFIPIDRRVRVDGIAPTVLGWRADPYDPYGDLLSLERSPR